jgi:hypothetical protein
VGYNLVECLEYRGPQAPETKNENVGVCSQNNFGYFGIYDAVVVRGRKRGHYKNENVGIVQKTPIMNLKEFGDV